MPLRHLTHSACFSCAGTSLAVYQCSCALTCESCRQDPSSVCDIASKEQLKEQGKSLLLGRRLAGLHVRKQLVHHLPSTRSASSLRASRATDSAHTLPDPSDAMAATSCFVRASILATAARVRHERQGSAHLSAVYRRRVASQMRRHQRSAWRGRQPRGRSGQRARRFACSLSSGPQRQTK